MKNVEADSGSYKTPINTRAPDETKKDDPKKILPF